MSYYTTVRGWDILRNVIVSGYARKYQVNKYFKNKCFFIIDNITSQAG